MFASVSRVKNRYGVMKNGNPFISGKLLNNTAFQPELFNTQEKPGLSNINPTNYASGLIHPMTEQPPSHGQGCGANNGHGPELMEQQGKTIALQSHTAHNNEKIA